MQAHTALRDLTPQEGSLMTNAPLSGPWCVSVANCRHFEAWFSTHTFSTKSSHSQCLGTESPCFQLLYMFPVHNHPSCDTHLCLSRLRCSSDLLVPSSPPLHPSVCPSLLPYIHSPTLFAHRLGSIPGCPGYVFSCTGCLRRPSDPSLLRHHKLLHSQPEGHVGLLVAVKATPQDKGFGYTISRFNLWSWSWRRNLEWAEHFVQHERIAISKTHGTLHEHLLNTTFAL